MTKWRYYDPHGQEWLTGIPPFMLSGTSVGKRELELMLRARRSWHGQLTIPHDRAHNAERMALRRLVQRGLFNEPQKLGGGEGTWRQQLGQRVWLYVYTLTDRGRECWLRTREEA